MESQNPQSDHDLLIRISQMLVDMKDNFNTFQTDVTKRLAKVETEKLDTKEFTDEKLLTIATLKITRDEIDALKAWRIAYVTGTGIISAISIWLVVQMIQIQPVGDLSADVQKGVEQALSNYNILTK